MFLYGGVGTFFIEVAGRSAFGVGHSVYTIIPAARYSWLIGSFTVTGRSLVITTALLNIIVYIVLDPLVVPGC